MKPSIVLGLVIIIGLIIWSVLKTNDYSENKYQYRPFNLFNLILTGAGSFFIILTSILDPGMQTSVSFLLIILALFCWLMALIKLVMKTSILIGVYAFSLQAIAGIFLALLMMVNFVSVNQKK